MNTLKEWLGVALIFIVIIIHAIFMKRKEESYWNAQVPIEPTDGHLGHIWDGNRSGRDPLR